VPFSLLHNVFYTFSRPYKINNKRKAYLKWSIIFVSPYDLLNIKYCNCTWYPEKADDWLSSFAELTGTAFFSASLHNVFPTILEFGGPGSTPVPSLTIRLLVHSKVGPQ
jgi:hypothetical protein